MSTGADNTGNTGNTGGSNTNIAVRAWLLVLNNPLDHNITHISQLTDLWAHLKSAGHVIQLEQGENGTPHYQGCVRFHNAIKFNTLKLLQAAIHWEPVRNWKAQIHYCCKAETRIGGPWIMGVKVTPPETIRLPTTLRGWQNEIINIVERELTVPDDRKIHWIYDERGNSGKTVLAKWIITKYPNMNPIYLSGKAGDCKCAVAKMVALEKAPKIAIFGFVRTNEKHISYQAIEEIKDGIFFSGKYDSGMCVYNPPTIICFANFYPDTEALSFDRWNIVNLSLTSGDDRSGNMTNSTTSE